MLQSGGEYVISSLASGFYKVVFIPGSESLFGGSSNGNYLLQYYNGKSSATQAYAVQVTAPGVTTNIGAELQPGGEISGIAKAATGKAPLEGVDVCANASTSNFFGSKCAVTNSNGEYKIVGLETATYTVDFSPPSGVNYLSASVPNVSVIAPNETKNIEGELQTGGQIAGMVSGASYTVQFVAPQGTNYAPQAQPGVSVTAPNTTPNIDAAMQPGGEISGRVTDAARAEEVQCGSRQAQAQVRAHEGAVWQWVAERSGGDCRDQGACKRQGAQSAEGRSDVARERRIQIPVGARRLGVGAHGVRCRAPAEEERQTPQEIGPAERPQAISSSRPTISCAQRA